MTQSALPYDLVMRHLCDARRLLESLRLLIDCDAGLIPERVGDSLLGLVDAATEKVAAAREILAARLTEVL